MYQEFITHVFVCVSTYISVASCLPIFRYAINLIPRLLVVHHISLWIPEPKIFITYFETSYVFVSVLLFIYLTAVTNLLTHHLVPFSLPTFSLPLFYCEFITHFGISLCMSSCQSSYLSICWNEINPSPAPCVVFWYSFHLVLSRIPHAHWYYILIAFVSVFLLSHLPTPNDSTPWIPVVYKYAPHPCLFTNPHQAHQYFSPHFFIPEDACTYVCVFTVEIFACAQLTRFIQPLIISRYPCLLFSVTYSSCT